MPHIPRIALLLCLTQWPLPVALSADVQLLPNDELSEGWVSLFDGQSLFGWKPATAANWRVEDEKIVVDQGTPGLLRTTCQYSDFELQLEFLAAPGTNSGLFVRSPPRPKDPAGDCYEINIAPPSNPYPTGGLVGRQAASQNGPSGDGWQSLHVVARGDKIVVRVNDRQVAEYTDPQPLGRGYIGLQFNHGRVAFRQLRLRPLGLSPIFNGRDLTGWNSHPDLDSLFTVTEDGELNVHGGRGQLETQQTFGDFVLQLECQTHAPRLNSGIFFRCIPGDIMMGYESQIENGFQDNDPTRPADCGTGGIFRRQNARRVVANDQVWFYKTIVAEGPHFAVWVNGYQVSDWSDTRPPDPNPRKGLRRQPGTIVIQGHDPNTNISFRHLRAGEMAMRRPTL